MKNVRYKKSSQTVGIALETCKTTRIKRIITGTKWYVSGKKGTTCYPQWFKRLVVSHEPFILVLPSDRICYFGTYHWCETQTQHDDL